MSRIQSPIRRKLRTLTLTILAMTAGNSTASAEWQENTHTAGNFSVMLPGAGKCTSTEYSSSYGGKGVSHLCKYTFSRGQVFVGSHHDPPGFLAKYNEQRRSEFFVRGAISERKSGYTGFTHEFERTRYKLLGRQTEMFRYTARYGNQWNELLSALVYINDVRYCIDLTQFGYSPKRPFSQKEIERIFSSFKLLNESGASIESANHAIEKDNGRAFFDDTTRVQWPVSAGGNGHYYQAVAEQPGISWDHAKAAAEKAGGYLVTITSKAENDFVFNLIDKPEYWTHSNAEYGPWIGCVQAPGSSEPDGGWGWGKAEGFSYSKWDAQQPNNRGSVNEDRVIYGLGSYRTSAWCDVRRDLPEIKAYVIEYDAAPKAAQIERIR